MGYLQRLTWLPPDELPRSWYNILPDLPHKPPPPRDDPEAKLKIQDLPRVMTKAGLAQENSDQRWVRIPEEVWDLYRLIGRPRPLHRAYNLEKMLGTPARIYFKREDMAPTGSHKMNHALPGIYYARQEGCERVVCETGAIQWGPAFAYFATLLGLKSRVYVVRSAYEYKVDRRSFIELCGGEAVASPSNLTDIGKRFLEEGKRGGSLGMAIAEALEDTLKHERTGYPIGSLLNHVLMYATINGLETKKQLEMIDEVPDIMIACFGGGSNFGGFALPFLGDVMKKKLECKFMAVQAGVDRFRNGEYKYDFIDEGEMLPLMKMYTTGVHAPLPNLYAEGLRYPAASPLVSMLVNEGFVEPSFYPPEKEIEVLKSGVDVLQTEGFLPAPESCYAVKAGIDEALKAKKEGKERVILVNVSGSGYMDMKSFRERLPASQTMKV